MNSIAAAAVSQRLDLSELAQLIAQADDRAFLVEGRVLRRLIRYDRRITGLGLRVPHRKTYVAARETLLEVVEPDELRPQREIPEGEVILVAEPDADDLRLLSRADLLRSFWRLLFHARVHLHLEDALRLGKLTEHAILQRMHRIGQTEFDEIASVLRGEGYLLPPRDTTSVYVEFAAVFLELRFFAPALLPRYFPALADSQLVESILAEDLDATALLSQTRVAGSSEASESKAGGEGPSQPTPARDELARPAGKRNDSLYRRLTRLAEHAESRGNVVRGALLRQQAARVGSPKQADVAQEGARQDLETLVKRLRGALHFSHEDAQRWRNGLKALLESSPRAGWTTEARLLFDLQKVCVDDEREIFKVDLVGWMLSWGRRPIRRQLPMQREVLICKHLRGAARRLTGAEIGESQRQSLEELLHRALHLAEEQMRQRLRPHVTKALEEAGLTPHHLVEDVARRKMVEELLDRVAARGYLQIGDLRDAVAQNHLKLPDLSGWRDFVFGDKLLSADGKLAQRLDGVYRRGEFYMRWFQRLSSLGFGNLVGRLITKYAVLPFGGAYMALEFLGHMLHSVMPMDNVDLVIRPLQQAVHGLPDGIASVAGEAAAETIEGVLRATVPVFGLVNVYTIGLLGIFLLLLINVGRFRRRVGEALRMVWTGSKAAAGGVVRIFSLPIMRRFLESRAVLYLWRFVVKPLVVPLAVGFLAWWTGNFVGGITLTQWLWLALVFFVTCAVLNSRVGRDMEERAGDWAREAWWRLQVHVIANLYYFIVDLFRAFLEYVDRVLYAVDEWLRFKTGETPLSFCFKLVMGSVWFFVTYVVRFSINLLVEPQINPLKHFPVVTVSHKLILPLAVSTSWAGTPSPLASMLLWFKLPISIEWANTLALSVVWGIPGIFGFLAWELKSNWRLYAANRSPKLKPCVLGSHGETMLRLMKPGFHSGTLPKLYRKLRRAERKAQKTGGEHAVRKYHEAIEHVKESVQRYVERELIALLNRYEAWPHKLEVGEIGTASNTVRIPIFCPSLDAAPLWLSFDEHSGWLMARVGQTGWPGRLEEPQRVIFRNALIGLYKTSGVDLVCEQIESLLDANRCPTTNGDGSKVRPVVRPIFDVSPDGLVVWPQPGSSTEAVYDLQSDEMQPVVMGAVQENGMPVLSRSEAVFSRQPLWWDDWVAAWEGKERAMQLLAPITVLPPSQGGSRDESRGSRAGGVA